jgi:hypothetical protein
MPEAEQLFPEEIPRFKADPAANHPCRRRSLHPAFRQTAEKAGGIGIASNGNFRLALF